MSFQNTLFQKIKTPCIGICSTGIGDSVCRGCHRFDYEVIHWNGYNEFEKLAIDTRLSNLLSGVMAKRFEIVDAAILAEQLRIQKIRYAEHRDAYCWLHALLRAGANQIKQPELFGFQAIASVAHLSLPAILKTVDREYYSLSVAHFERYIVANSRRASCVSADEFGEDTVVEP